MRLHQVYHWLPEPCHRIPNEQYMWPSVTQRLFGNCLRTQLGAIPTAVLRRNYETERKARCIRISASRPIPKWKDRLYFIIRAGTDRWDSDFQSCPPSKEHASDGWNVVLKSLSTSRSFYPLLQHKKGKLLNGKWYDTGFIPLRTLEIENEEPRKKIYTRHLPRKNGQRKCNG